jgi:hypothetical protein
MPAWLAALLTRKMLICIFTGFSPACRSTCCSTCCPPGCAAKASI